MSETYTTIQGETWDEVALKVYGDEVHADWVMKNNFEHLETLVFSAGTVLKTPPLPEETPNTLPPWRRPATAETDPYDN